MFTSNSLPCRDHSRARSVGARQVTNLRVAIDRPIQPTTPDELHHCFSPSASGTTPSTTSSLPDEGPNSQGYRALGYPHLAHRTDVYSCCHRPHRTDATGDTPTGCLEPGRRQKKKGDFREDALSSKELASSTTKCLPSCTGVGPYMGPCVRSSSPKLLFPTLSHTMRDEPS